MHTSHECMPDASEHAIRLPLSDQKGSDTTADPLRSQTIALHAVDHLCTVATAQAQVRPNQHQTVGFACWSTIIALLQTTNTADD